MGQGSRSTKSVFDLTCDDTGNRPKRGVWSVEFLLVSVPIRVRLIGKPLLSSIAAWISWVRFLMRHRRVTPPPGVGVREKSVVQTFLSTESTA